MTELQKEHSKSRAENDIDTILILDAISGLGYYVEVDNKNLYCNNEILSFDEIDKLHEFYHDFNIIKRDFKIKRHNYISVFNLIVSFDELMDIIDENIML